jgi:hypothetical protein
MSDDDDENDDRDIFQPKKKRSTTKVREEKVEPLKCKLKRLPMEKRAKVGGKRPSNRSFNNSF